MRLLDPTVHKYKLNITKTTQSLAASFLIPKGKSGERGGAHLGFPGPPNHKSAPGKN